MSLAAERSTYCVGKRIKGKMSALEHLRRTIFVSAGDYMSMFAIYCDDSGTDEQSRVAAVAGYLGKVSQWSKFEKAWKEALKEFGVKQMHRADLENYKGEFEGWDGARRTTFLQRVQPLIREYTTVPIASAVIKEDFYRIIPEPIQRQFGGVYGWCAHECLVALSIWYQRKQYRNPIQWVFEAGTIGHGQVAAMFQELHSDPVMGEQCYIKGWSFQDKSVVPLQAADVLAYEVYKQVTNQIVDRGRNWPVRFSIKNLVRNSDDRFMKYWGERRLIEWVEESNKRNAL